MSCQHPKAHYTTSQHATKVGFTPRTLKQSATAAGLNQAEADAIPGPSTYPLPLVVPEDELSWDPKYPAQDLASTKRCLNSLDRKPGGRHVVYVAAPPSITRSSSAGMKNWSKLRLPKSQQTNLLQTPKPRTEDVLRYISAFYHGLPVKLLPQQLKFTTWTDDSKASSKTTKQSSFPSAIALQTSTEAIRIRCRELDTGPAVAQLNLNDLLDVAISILPKDAYALLMLIEQDIYEHDEDDFCCGRAYGGSRIACVSSFRYHPAADIEQDVDLEHAWPVSHCADYVNSLCADSEPEKPKKKLKREAELKVEPAGPLRAAMDAYPKNLDLMTLEAYAGLWLGRFCRTASHELGHCFGIDHCVYYACVMQGTSSVVEDNRQPPYLCPVDLAKVLHSTSVTEKQHHSALLKFCSESSDDAGALFWKPFAAWLEGRLSIKNSES